MIGERWIASAGLAAVLALGCGRGNPQGSAPSASATETGVPVMASTSVPAANADAASPQTQPAAGGGSATAEVAGTSTLMIDGQFVAFPPARLKLTQSAGAATAILYSADPKHAIDNDYVGNSFYLVMPLDIGDAQELGTAEWHYRAGNEEELNSTEGIFLHGLREHLQPADVVVRFAGTSNVVQVQFLGQQDRPWSDFLLFDTAAGGPPRHAQISGTVFATVDVKPAH